MAVEPIPADPEDPADIPDGADHVVVPFLRVRMSGSHMIHADMFRGLRDARVVLADLSLANPNVYYELGIRHVMASRGTVLICVAGAELPFDVRLSRVLFYHYDGQYLDWEEKRVVDQLQRALEDLSCQEPDSPVHAMLEQVLPDEELARYTAGAAAIGGAADTPNPLIPIRR